jgi:hypothetical protein
LDKLLLVGALSDEDVERLLIMIHPESWDPTFEKSKIKKHKYLSFSFPVSILNVEKVLESVQDIEKVFKGELKVF